MLGDTAIAYARMGWAVFPCHSIVRGQCTCTRPNCKSAGKHPRTKNGHKDATTNEATIRYWWETNPESNIGVAAGEVSGFFVIDVDKDKGGFDSLTQYQVEHGAFPDTVVSITGSGGRHFLFQWDPEHPIANSQNWLKGVDIRGNGGYIIAPPSVHESGGRYAWKTSGVSIALPPIGLVESIHNRASNATKERVPDLTTLMAEGLKEGSRDETLFRIACKERRLHQNDADEGREFVTAALTMIAASCDPPFPQDELLRKIASAYRQDHSDPEFPEIIIPEDEETQEPSRPVREPTDVGNAQRFVDAYGDEFRYVRGWGWMWWDGKRWSSVNNEHEDKAKKLHELIRRETSHLYDDEQIKIMKRWAIASQNVGRVKAALTLAESDPRIVRDLNQFDAQPYLLNCGNGVVDLRDGSMQPHDRDLMMTHCTNVDFVRNYHNVDTKWIEFLRTSCEGDIELMAYLQRVAGYTLYGMSEAEAFFIVHGPAGTGKSTFIDGLSRALGEYSYSTNADTLMQQRYGGGARQDELARMVGMRLVVAAETGEGNRMNEALVKQITGGDTIQARELFQKSFNFKATFSLWIATNHAPIIRDDAIFRRINKIPFVNPIPEDQRDLELKNYIKDPNAGAKAALSWAIDGAIFYHNLKRLNPPDRVTKETAEYRMDNDRIGAFIRDSLIATRGARVEIMEVYRRYQLWAIERNESPLAMQSFTTRLKDRAEIEVQTTEDGQQFALNVRIKDATASWLGQNGGS